MLLWLYSPVLSPAGAVLPVPPVGAPLCVRGHQVILLSENPKYPPRYVLEGDELTIWGVITSTVRSHSSKPPPPCSP